jgi:signal-transduction protein with cAMP-binding, CBS, and nucleotidyltransferase domain
VITALDEIGTSPAVICPHGTPISQVARAMSEHHVGCVILIDDDQCLTGIVTDRDLTIRAIANELPCDTPVSQVMTHEVASVLHHASLLDAARQMANRACRRLPVVDEHGKVRAVLSVDDVYREAGELLEQLEGILARRRPR